MIAKVNQKKRQIPTFQVPLDNNRILTWPFSVEFSQQRDMATWCAVSWNVGGSADRRDCSCWERRKIHDISWSKKSKTFQWRLANVVTGSWELTLTNWQTGLTGLKIVKMHLDARAIRDEDKMECIFPALCDIKRYGESREKISYVQRKKITDRTTVPVTHSTHADGHNLHPHHDAYWLHEGWKQQLKLHVIK